MSWEEERSSPSESFEVDEESLEELLRELEETAATSSTDKKEGEEEERMAVSQVGEESPLAVSRERAWYIVHCYAGSEHKVKHSLEQRIASLGMQRKIFNIVVPEEEEIELREGKKRPVRRRIYPGYILVEMIMDEDSWAVVRFTPGVTGFVGMGNQPTPLRPEEVQAIFKRMESKAPRIRVTFKPGQKVRITEGPFADFVGIVDEIDLDKAKVRVLVSFFGRETPVELDFTQVEKI
ncbi:transcription termination/antitermination protein NusG [Thermoflexus sp.]|uniref:transcription termination/antitermination protein NusG n=2 Tax=Thermoflexus sp. TaxID=1969742 RepID=UPI0025F8F5C3|nr:transcription termination/antitermination protein NusG [Thermoflexus sp.]MCS6964125.1 transcription termination/antitermination protein NusG [Thermoflexus sp.]MCX7689970.1 transcription termination/antitermination protein NusG [Thermoflexus sp.]